MRTRFNGNSLNSKTTSASFALTFSETQTIFTNNASRGFKVGDSIVLVKLDGTIANASSNWATVCTGLPAPSYNINWNIVNNAGSVIRARITPSGTLDIVGNNTGALGTSLIYIAN